MRTDPRAEPAAAAGGSVLTGLGVSPGIAIGPVHVVEAGVVQAPEYVIVPDARDAEQARFRAAVAKAVKQLSKLKAKTASLPDAAAEEIAYLLDAHLSILSGSRLIRGVEARIRDELANAEAAVHAEMTGIAQQFEAMDDPYLASRIQDIREVGNRLLRNLADKKYKAFSGLEPGSIVIAEEITPADTALMEPGRIGAFATMLGGAEGHTAIMARSLGIPAVLGVAGLMRGVTAGRTVIVDGTVGRVIVDPDAATLAEYDARRAELEADREQLRTLIELPASSRDGTDVALMANLELPREAAGAAAIGADGIGLLRTEFLFMNRDDLPDEDEQLDSLKTIVEGMAGRPVTMRTLDVGGEKLASALGDAIGGGPNPALGLRAIRLSLRRPDLLETQLAAMLRAGALGPIRILLPMIVAPAEVRAVRAAIDRVAARLRAAGTPIADPLPPLGAMIEIPGAALAADALAREVDFFAIGTNDLIMYTLAIDRGDEQVAELYDPLHPAVLRLIAMAADAAHAAGIPISVCGEMAGEPRFTALLLGLGVDELSMGPGALLPVKRRLRSLDLPAARTRAGQILAQTDPGRIAALLDDLNDGA
jgi:phosphotransferase system enzyme I (PtsI)